MSKLELPLTLRLPRLDEVPHTPDLLESIRDGIEAKIIEGFTVMNNENSEFSFTFYAQININNSRLWDLFKVLALHLPDEISLIFGHADDEPFYGEYRDKYEVLNTISNYTTELTKDCFLEFGAIHHAGNFLEEVFVDCTKYIKYWGADKDWFRQTMADFELFEIPDLNFIDQFPKVREAIHIHYNNTLFTEETILRLKEQFI